MIMLLAGIGFMGALQDALSGFYVTAGARLTEALLATAGIIAGVSGGLTFGEVIGVDVGRLDPGLGGDLKGVPVMALGAAICAAGFAFASYAPARSFVPIGLVAAVAMVISQSIGIGGFGRTWSTALAAFFVGLVSYGSPAGCGCRRWWSSCRRSCRCCPGLSIYRGLSLLTEGGAETSEGLLALITAASVAIALAAGVILGEYVAQPLRREARGSRAGWPARAWSARCGSARPAPTAGAPQARGRLTGRLRRSWWERASWPGWRRCPGSASRSAWRAGAPRGRRCRPAPAPCRSRRP